LYPLEVLADSPDPDLGLEAANLAPEDGLKKISPELNETGPSKNSRKAAKKNSGIICNK